jgi:DNA-binding MarR family transcriptional regulator
MLRDTIAVDFRAMNANLDANRLGALWTTLDDLMAEVVHDYSESSAAILLTLHYWAPMSVNSLTAIVGLSQPACSRALDNLLGGGLVEKQRGAGKELELQLTGAGKRQAGALQKRRLSACATLLAPLSKSELATFNTLVDKLLKAPVTTRAYARHVCRFCDHATCDGPLCPIGSAARATEHGASEEP